MERTTVALLARELGVRPNGVFKLAATAGVSVKRVAAQLTPGQADRIRAQAEKEEAERKMRRAALPPATTQLGPAPAPHTMTTEAVVESAPPHGCACCRVDLGPPASDGRLPGDDTTVRRCRTCAALVRIAGEDDRARTWRGYETTTPDCSGRMARRGPR